MTDLELPPLPLSVGSVDISSPERGIACAKPGLPYFNREMMESYARLAIQSHLEALAKRGLEDLRDAVFEHLHKAIGYCGHCGKKTCAGKQSNSKLPESIPTRLLVEAFDAAATEGDSSAD